MGVLEIGYPKPGLGFAQRGFRKIEVNTMERIVVLGGGIGGYHVAKGLMKRLQPSKAEVLLVDARPNLEYQPFLAEVVSGAIKPDRIQIPLASNIRGAKFLQARVTDLCVAAKTVSVVKADGDRALVPYDQLVVALGCETRYLPIPGLERNATGLKSVEDADFLRKKLIANIVEASRLPKGSAQRQRLLTFVVIGAGFSGVELFSELFWAARMLAKKADISKDELSFHLIDVADRIVADLPLSQSCAVVAKLESLGGRVHLNTLCQDVSDGIVRTSRGGVYPAGMVAWTAGLRPAPCLANSDLPLSRDGRLCCQADLRVVGESGVVEGVWGLGDCCRVPDKTGAGLPDGSCAPTAQHALRQARRISDNIVAVMHGGRPVDYYHENAGMVGGFGPGYGAFVSGSKKICFQGFPAWLCHRFYHALAMPSWASRFGVLADYFDARNLS